MHQEGFEPSVRFFLELSNFLTAIPQQNVANSPIYRSLLLHYVLCFRGNRTTHTSQHHCSFLLELITLRYQEDETYYLAASPIYAINQHFVEAVGLEPTHTRHQILSLARLPITTRPELKHPNDFRSHICRVPDGFNSPSPYEPKTLINILTPWIYPIL